MLTLDFELLALFLAGGIGGTHLRHLHVFLVFVFIIAIFVWIDSLLRKFF